MATQNRLCYFYVVIPPEDQKNSGDVSKAVSTSTELTALMKKNPNARFQSGSTPEEAMQKAMEKIQMTQDTDSIPTPPSQTKRKGRQSFSAVEASIGAPAVASPKTGELLQMGRDILARRNEKVLDTIEANPRILCTDSEFPTILQEGCKYNALHLAARSNNDEVMRKILSLTSSVEFMRRIYPSQTEEILRSGCKHLVSCYLNTPDKMFQETPLHFACKHNSVECVEIILSHPFCNTSLINIDQSTPFQIIGSRDNKTGAKADAIRNLFARRYIVPIWRDLTMEGDPPVMGEVCYIPDLGQAIPEPLLNSKFPDFSVSLLEPCKEKILPRSNNVKVFISQPPVWKIHAFAGPVDEHTAKEFRKMMKRSRHYLGGFTSPDTSFNTNTTETSPFGIGIPLNSTPPGPGTPKRNSFQYTPNTPPSLNQLLLSPIRSPLSIRQFSNSPMFTSPVKMDTAQRVRDVEKGLERNACEHCQRANIPWSEYWKFLGKFCDLSTESGLELLEAHLQSIEADKNKTRNETNNSDATGHSRSSSLMDDIINKLQGIRLNSSGIPSPDGSRAGFCNNPLCREQYRFCNCENVVPKVPYDQEDDSRWIFGNVEDIFGGVQPKEVPFGIRKLTDMSFNTDSFDISSGSWQGDLEFEWPCPEEVPEKFSTAPTSPAEAVDVFEDCWDTPVYLSGNKEPGKLDYQIFQILKECSDVIDKDRFTTVFQWYNSIRSHGSNLLKREEPKYTPKRLWEPSFMSTPTKKTAGSNDSF